MYPVLGAGNANTIYKRPDGLLRVSKTGRNVDEIINNMDFWRARMPQWVLAMTPVNDEHFGAAILMEHVGAHELLAEFKPKWLLQSPDAPANARACRTCAVDAMRGRARTWCPLALARKQDLAEFAARIGSSDPAAVTALLNKSTLIDDLLRWQAGPSTFGEPTADFLNAMSARDCTVLVDRLPSGEVRARVVDLDPKQPTNMAKWRDIETSLRPFYTSGVPGCLLYEQDAT